MCNVPVRGGQRPYGRDALVAVPAYEYGEGQNYGLTDDSEPIFEEEESEYANIHPFKRVKKNTLPYCKSMNCSIKECTSFALMKLKDKADWEKDVREWMLFLLSVRVLCCHLLVAGKLT